MARRPTSSGIAHALAECSECDWRAENVGAVGQAAQHHDRTGHEVKAEQLITVTYGNAPTPEELGQLTIDDAKPPANVT